MSGTYSPQRSQAAGPIISEDNWAKRASTGYSFRKSQVLAAERKPKFQDKMRLSVDSIGYHPGTAQFESRPHTATTAKRNTSVNMANLIGSRPFSAKTLNEKSVEYYVHPSMKPPNTNFSPSLPKFVQTDKQVLRFYGYFFEDRVWDRSPPLGGTTIEPMMCRHVTIFYYISDDTIEMMEPRQANSGLYGGRFFRRDNLIKEDGTTIGPLDISVGGVIRALSRDFYVTDADEFTRNYYSHEFGVTLAPTLDRPEQVREDLGALYATGLVTNAPRRTGHHATRSTDYDDKRRINMRAKAFLSFDGRVMRFQAIETSGTEAPSHLKEGQKVYLVLYHVVDKSIEVRLMKASKTSVDDMTTVVKRCELPKNWRAVNKEHADPVLYEPSEMVCGNVVDCFGRHMLLFSCDGFTKRLSAELGVEQRDIDIRAPRPEQFTHPIPKQGEFFLSIGNEEDTLRTVHHAPKTKKDTKRVEVNRGKVLRAKVRMLSDNSIKASRTFSLLFYLEDDTVQLFEDQTYNSGIEAGRYLKRGKYVNTLPADSNAPRPFLATDVYLGNVFGVHGEKFQITAIDALAVKICEDRPKEFPMFDAFQVAGKVLHRVLSMNEDLRAVLSSARVDRERRGWLAKEELLTALEGLRITQSLNDQEVSTLLSRVKDVKEERFFYHELCDLFSYLAFIQKFGENRDDRYFAERSAIVGMESDNRKEALMLSLRGRRVQWRRIIRRDPRTFNGFATLATLKAIFRRQGVRLSRHNADLIRDLYQAYDEEALETLKKLDQPPLFDNKVSNTSLDVKNFTNELERPDIRSSSRLMRTTLVGVSISPWMGAKPPTREQRIMEKPVSRTKDIPTQRSEVMTSVLRSSLNMDEVDFSASAAPETDHYVDFKMDPRDTDESYVVIDYNALCNDIYADLSE